MVGDFPGIGRKLDNVLVEGVIILRAVVTDTNPKRQRGNESAPSLALRVSMDCANLNRSEYI
jgi:hypothetical protein